MESFSSYFLLFLFFFLFFLFFSLLFSSSPFCPLSRLPLPLLPLLFLYLWSPLLSCSSSLLHYTTTPLSSHHHCIIEPFPFFLLFLSFLLFFFPLPIPLNLLKTALLKYFPIKKFIIIRIINLLFVSCSSP